MRRSRSFPARTPSEWDADELTTEEWRQAIQELQLPEVAPQLPEIPPHPLFDPPPGYGHYPLFHHSPGDEPPLFHFDTSPESSPRRSAEIQSETQLTGNSPRPSPARRSAEIQSETQSTGNSPRPSAARRSAEIHSENQSTGNSLRPSAARRSAEIHSENQSLSGSRNRIQGPAPPNLESQPPERPDPFDSLNRFLWIFGFYRNPFGGFIFFLECLVAFAALAGIIFLADLDFGYSRPAVFLCVFLPLLCCAIPPAVLIMRVSLSQGISRFFALPDGSNVQLPVGPRIFALIGISILVIFEVMYLVMRRQNLFWRIIKFTAWTYFLAVYIVSVAVILMRIVLCKGEITELYELLGTTVVNQDGLGFMRHRIDRLRQLERSFASLTRGISGYMCSLFIITPVIVCASLGIFYQWWCNDFADDDDGASFFAMLSLIQGLTVWILFGMCNDLNLRFEGLARTAGRVCTDAHILEAEAEREPETEEEVNQRRSIEVLEGLRLVEHEVRHSRARISVFCSEIDVALMLGILGIQISFVALTTGAYMSFLLPKVLK